ncbi:MAG: class I SAM-dependent methyltransferase [Janthinobacterium sp.]
MKRCGACQALYPPTPSACPACGHAPPILDGFPAYAPELAHGGGGFKANYFADLAKLESDNFWFRARNELILMALEKYCQGFQSFLEIGCGTAYVLSGVARRHPTAALYGSEIFVAALGFAAARLPSAQLMQMDARNLPFREEFDVIGAFDVLEHIDEDEQVLVQIHAALKTGGVCLLTVPQHDWLWSPVDDYACHVRRYAAADLHGKLAAAGFAVVRSTSFVSLLLPAMLLSRMKKKNDGARFDAADELRLAPALNALLYRLMRAEIGLIGLGLDFPLGGSRLIVAKKEARP